MPSGPQPSAVMGSPLQEQHADTNFPEVWRNELGGFPVVPTAEHANRSGRDNRRHFTGHVQVFGMVS